MRNVLPIVSKLSGDGGVCGHQYFSALCSPVAAAMARGSPHLASCVSSSLHTASCSLLGASGSSSLRAGRSSMSNGVNGPRTKNSWWQRQETRAQGVIGREEMIYYIKHLSFFSFSGQLRGVTVHLYVTLLSPSSFYSLLLSATIVPRLRVSI